MFFLVIIIIETNKVNSKILSPKKCIFILKCTNLLLPLQ